MKRCFLAAGKLAEKREDAEKQVGRLLPQIDLLEQRLTSLSLAEHYEADGYDEKLKARTDSRAKLSGTRKKN